MRELRVYGPPGTGKTTHLKGRVEATARARGASSIRIASLTRAAAAEIGNRVTLEREQIGTLHAHAFRALEHPPLAETREGVTEWNNYVERAVPGWVLPDRRRDAILDDAGGEALVARTDGEGLLAQMQVNRAKMLPRELWQDKVRAFADRWDGFKARQGRLDFADLIERATEEFPYMPGAPTVFLLDEAQDMSRAEMRLARQWGESCEVFVVVGDPYQNLYQWRGSEPEAFDDAELDDERVSVLSQSYRVPHAVHEFAVDWLNRELPGGLRVAYDPRDAEGAVRTSTETYKSPEGLSQQLERDLDAGMRVMVLGATGYMLDPLIALLKRRGVPFGNPYRTNHGGWNPLNGATRVLAFLRPDRAVHGDGARLWDWNEVRLWTDPLKAQGVLKRGAKTFIEGKCIERDLGRVRDDAGTEIVDSSTFFELFEEEHRDAVFELSLAWYEEHLLASRAKSLAYSLNVAHKHGGKALLDAPGASPHGTDDWPGLILGTIHSVKGGEADRVYVFPDLSNAGFDGWLIPGWRRDAIVRQFYVAFTRAREELVLCEPSSALGVRFEER